MTNNRTTDMTSGKPLPLILRFALPILLGNCFQLVYSMVDTLVAGHFLGEGAIAAIGATGVIFSLIMNFAWGLNSGYCIVLSRVLGSGDREKFRHAVSFMLALNFLAASIFTLLSLLIIEPVMTALKTPADIFSDAHLYIVIIIAGMAATIAYNMASGFMNAVGNSKIPLYFLIFSSLANVALDIVFAVVFKAGIAGLALATVIAQAISAAFSIAFIIKNYAELLPKKGDFFSGKGDAALGKEMISSGLSMALMQSVVGLGTVALQRAINLLGTDYIAAHTASRKLFDLLMVPMATLAIANSTFTSQNCGAGRFGRIRKANCQMILLELAWSLFSVAVAFLGGRNLASWLTGSENEVIIKNAALYLRFSTLFFFPLGILFVLRYSMQTLGHKIVPVLSSGIELALKIVFALAVVPRMGYWGVVITEPVIWFSCAAVLTAFYLTKGNQRIQNEQKIYGGTNDRT